tara:strand:+ start:243 stop:812 length:570 start_codon:yes stop_codon:yes gene_type:complete
VSEATGAQPDPESLRRLLSGLREFPPKVRTRTRKALRGTGDEIIAGQRARLDGALPGGIRKSGSTRILVHSKRKGKFFLVKKNLYSDRDVQRGGRSTGLREGIKAGLRTRVVTGKTRQGIEIKTTGPKVDGYNKAKFWNKRRFRHPVFGNRDHYVDQAGQPYFRAPAFAGRDDMLRRTEQILRDAANSF